MSQKKVVTFGEIMMRLSTPAHARFTQATQFNIVYGGSEANVAVSLSNFGVPAEHVTRFPNNDFGKASVAALKQQGVSTDHIVFGDERMGVYFLENGAMQRASRIIYDRFDSAFAHIGKGMLPWEEILKNASWFHWTGITPAIAQGAADACLEALQVAKKLNVPVSGDINYRRNLWQYGKTARQIMPSLMALTDYVVAGITDFENCAGITGSTYEEACRLVVKEYPNIKKVATTVRDSISSSHNKISAMLWDGRGVIKANEYDLTSIVDRIGAGDAFMAGLIYGWVMGKDDQQTLDFATAACAWKHSVEGDVNLATSVEIETLVKGENIGKLLR